VVALLAGRHDERLRTEKGTHSAVARTRMGEKVVVLAVPDTYMNESGLAVRSLARRFGIDETSHVVEANRAHAHGVHLGQLSVAHVRVHGRDAAGAPVRRDQRVEHGAVVGPVTGGLDDDVLVDA